MSDHDPERSGAAAAGILEEGVTYPDSTAARWKLGFWSLIVTQFQGAFNDNALKFLVIYLIVDLGLPRRERDWLILIVGALFAIPFILFSMTGGFLADRFSKRSVTIATKCCEIPAMCFCVLALSRGSFYWEAVGAFFISSLAALFGPSKYGLLPEILPEKDLSWGNGIIELGTFLAAISATVASGYLAFYFRGRQEWSGILLLGCTLLGLAISMAITRVPAANPTRKFNPNPLGDFFEQFKVIRQDAILQWAFVGNMYLWFLAALLQFTIVVYGHDVLRIDERHISYLQAAVAIGIGTGALITGYLSSGKIEYGLIPLGAVGMTVMGFLSATHGLSFQRVAVYLGLLGFFGGFYAVPLNALIQHRPDPARKGGVIAAANLVSFIGVFFAAGVYFVLAEGLHFRADKIFFAGACMTLAATFYAIVLLPDSLLRLVLWTLTHTLYRIRVRGRDNIPERGGALFVTGRLELLETILLSALTDRRIRFLVDETEMARTSTFVERVLRISTFGASSDGAKNGVSGQLSTSLSGRTLNPVEALRSAATAAFQSDEVVCLASEDALALLAQDSLGHGRVADFLNKEGAPIVMVSEKDALGGALCGNDGRVSWAIPAHLPCKVIVRFGPPLSPSLPPAEMRRAFEANRADRR